MNVDRLGGGIWNSAQSSHTVLLDRLVEECER